MASVLNGRNLCWNLPTKVPTCFYGTSLSALFAENAAIFLLVCISKNRSLKWSFANIITFSYQKHFRMIYFIGKRHNSARCTCQDFYLTWPWCAFHISVNVFSHNTRSFNDHCFIVIAQFVCVLLLSRWLKSALIHHPSHWLLTDYPRRVCTSGFSLWVRVRFYSSLVKNLKQSIDYRFYFYFTWKHELG